MAPSRQRCHICGRWFRPEPFAWKQKVCTRPMCRRIAQQKRLKEWRKRNPDYFRGDYRKTASLKKWKKQKLYWQKRHPEYFKKWRRKNRDKYNAYMREYRNKQSKFKQR